MSVITLLTDFGSQDGYVAAMVGYLHTHAANTKVYEVSHDITPQDVWQAAFALKRYAKEFPAETIHISVIDPGVGSDRKALALKCDRQWLIGPDNGVLSLAAELYENVEAFQIRSNTPWWNKHSSFDGLALFTPAALKLATAPDNIHEYLSPLPHFHQLSFPKPDVVGQQMMGQIVTFDRFGNAITNITKADIPSDHPVIIYSGHHRFETTTHYCNAPANGQCAIINSDGLLELAVYQGSARSELGLEVGHNISFSISE
ncbi:MAG: SAM-dependent chlorinase/fluorinase [Gammaproteobacteria bacterium]|nr:SAM-dependent chlorinase/fluorinase [Gammaproteobacteria bacterium]